MNVVIWLLDLFCINLTKQSALSSLGCCETCWLDQLNRHSTCSAHSRDNAFLGDCGVCSHQSFFTHGKIIFSLLASACAGPKMSTHQIRRLLCLPAEIPPAKQHRICHCSTVLWDSNLNYLSTLLWNSLQTILSMQQAVIKYLPWSLCPGACEKSTGTRRELEHSQTFATECTCLAV